MMKTKRIKPRTWWMAAIAAVAVVASVSFASLPDREFQILKNMDIFYSLFREVNLFYVDDPNPEALVNSGIDGMLSSLDPYTNFIPEEEADDYKTITTGQYGGLGVTVRNIDSAITVVELSPDFPADRAGIRVGDRLIKADGQTLIDKEVDQVSELLRGTPGTDVKLTYRRVADGKEITKSITRQTITIPNVPYYGLLDAAQHTGYIRLTNFSADAGHEVKEALLDLKKRHNISSLVLDLRGNPGGLLMEAVEVVNLFVPRGKEVVSTRGRVKQWDNIYITRHEPVDTTIALAVVVNRASASASEIVAGAIQDMDRGVIVGQRTFGKGLVQATRPLNYNAQLKITTAKYYIPSGRCIQALDYTHREPDGSVGYIPDSLIREYKTLKTHRIVRDGGGVSPDVEVRPDTLSRIAITLYVHNLIFNYATIYAQQHDSIAAASSFALSDSDYAAFTRWLSSKSFDYQTETEALFAQLKQAAKQEKYFDGAAAQFAQMEKDLSHDRVKDLYAHKDDICALLTEEIVSRYYYNRGRIASTIRHNDAQIKTAQYILSDDGRYRELLGLSD